MRNFHSKLNDLSWRQIIARIFRVTCKGRKDIIKGKGQGQWGAKTWRVCLPNFAFTIFDNFHFQCCYFVPPLILRLIVQADAQSFLPSNEICGLLRTKFSRCYFARQFLHRCEEVLPCLLFLLQLASKGMAATLLQKIHREPTAINWRLTLLIDVLPNMASIMFKITFKSFFTGKSESSEI